MGAGGAAQGVVRSLLDAGAARLVIANRTVAKAEALAARFRGVLREEMLAYDMVYGRDTPFLGAARLAGARACDGLGMLVKQAAESFYIWRGVRPDTRSVLERLRASR